MSDYTAAVAGHDYEAEILWACTNGLMEGDENDNFNPDKTLTRAEACTALSQFVYPEKRLTVDWEEAQRRYEEAINAP